MNVALLMLIGLALGSFTNALVWRVHEQSKKKNAKNKDFSILKGRSMCPSCHHTLSSLDLVPVFSWLLLKGHCRYCKKRISWQYPLVELVGAALFVVSYIFWPYELAGFGALSVFGVWLAIVITAVALAVYDLRWMLLPNRLVYSLAGFGILFTLVSVHSRDAAVLLSSVLGCIGYGGFFYILYQISGGKWIGGGDVRLGFVLGIILGWQKSILGLTLAAYLGTLVIGILYLMGKYHRKMKLPFGPFLLAAMFLTMLWGQQLIDWYLRISGL